MRQPNQRDRRSLHEERGTYNPRIRAIILLPRAIADHRDWRGGPLIVRVVDNPSGKGPETKNMEVTPAHVLSAQGTCLAVFGFLPNAVNPRRGLKSGGFLELGCRCCEMLVEGIREQAPVIVLPTLDTALLGIQCDTAGRDRRPAKTSA